jgi:hypothetical protein
VAALDRVADLGQSGVELGGGFHRQSRRAPTGQMPLGDALEFDLADIGQTQRRDGCAGRRSYTCQHGGQQSVAEGVGVGGVAEQAVGQPSLGQSIRIACGAAAQRRLNVKRAIVLVVNGPVQPRLDPDVGPALGRHHFEDLVGAFDFAQFDARGGGWMSGLDAHGRFRGLGARVRQELAILDRRTAPFNRCGAPCPGDPQDVDISM